LEDAKTYAAWNYYVTFIIEEKLLKPDIKSKDENDQKSEAESLDGP